MIAGVLAGWAFRLIGPEARPGSDGHFHVRRADGSVATLIDTPAAPLEAAIVDFGDDDAELKGRLRPLLAIRRMSRLTAAALLSAAVGEMPDDRVFVNVGVWNGFTMLSAMAGNAGKPCIGVDNFSEFGGPKAAFLERFTAVRSPAHRFFEMDYVDFFAAGLDRPLGVYLYDGEHSYEHQYRGLMVADPFYADGAVIVVDDANLDRARDATLQFAADSRLDWQVVYDQRTARRRHPTLWNGLLVIEAGRGARAPVTLPVRDSLEGALVERGDGRGSGVSVLSLDAGDLPGLVAAGCEVVPVAGPGDLRDAVLERSTGRFVLIVEAGAAPAPKAVVHAVRLAQQEAGKAGGD